MSSSDEEDQLDCPLCMEELDVSDKYFKPCPCGYQICRFCWNYINKDLNGLCPACRRKYSEDTLEFKPVSPEELNRIKNAKKKRDREKKEQELMNRKQLANVRVVQKNLVYVLGLSAKVANEDTLRQMDYFGQFGKITKVVINRRPIPNGPPNAVSFGVYVTFAKKEEAARAIEAVDGTICDNRMVRATYGTTKYCSFYLKGQTCQNPGCQYLHEPGEEADSFNREESIKSAGRQNKPPVPVLGAGRINDKDESALPMTASWAKAPRHTPSYHEEDHEPIKEDRQVPTIDQFPGLAAAQEMDKKGKRASSGVYSGTVSESSSSDQLAQPASLEQKKAATLSTKTGSMVEANQQVPIMDVDTPPQSLFDMGFRLVMKYNGLLDPFSDNFSLDARKPLSTESDAAARQKAVDTAVRSRMDRMLNSSDRDYAGDAGFTEDVQMNSKVRQVSNASPALTANSISSPRVGVNPAILRQQEQMYMDKVQNQLYGQPGMPPQMNQNQMQDDMLSQFIRENQIRNQQQVPIQSTPGRLGGEVPFSDPAIMAAKMGENAARLRAFENASTTAPSSRNQFASDWAQGPASYGQRSEVQSDGQRWHDAKSSVSTTNATVATTSNATNARTESRNVPKPAESGDGGPPTNVKNQVLDASMAGPIIPSKPALTTSEHDNQVDLHTPPQDNPSSHPLPKESNTLPEPKKSKKARKESSPLFVLSAGPSALKSSRHSSPSTSQTQLAPSSSPLPTRSAPWANLVPSAMTSDPPPSIPKPTPVRVLTITSASKNQDTPATDRVNETGPRESGIVSEKSSTKPMKSEPVKPKESPSVETSSSSFKPSDIPPAPPQRLKKQSKSKKKEERKRSNLDNVMDHSNVESDGSEILDKPIIVPPVTPPSPPPTIDEASNSVDSSVNIVNAKKKKKKKKKAAIENEDEMNDAWFMQHAEQWMEFAQRIRTRLKDVDVDSVQSPLFNLEHAQQEFGKLSKQFEDDFRSRSGSKADEYLKNVLQMDSQTFVYKALESFTKPPVKEEEEEKEATNASDAIFQFCRRMMNLTNEEERKFAHVLMQAVQDVSDGPVVDKGSTSCSTSGSTSHAMSQPAPMDSDLDSKLQYVEKLVSLVNEPIESRVFVQEEMDTLPSALETDVGTNDMESILKSVRDIVTKGVADAGKIVTGSDLEALVGHKLVEYRVVENVSPGAGSKKKRKKEHSVDKDAPVIVSPRPLWSPSDPLLNSSKPHPPNTPTPDLDVLQKELEDSKRKEKEIEQQLKQVVKRNLEWQKDVLETLEPGLCLHSMEEDLEFD